MPKTEQSQLTRMLSSSVSNAADKSRRINTKTKPLSVAQRSQVKRVLHILHILKRLQQYKHCFLFQCQQAMSLLLDTSQLQRKRHCHWSCNTGAHCVHMMHVEACPQPDNFLSSACPLCLINSKSSKIQYQDLKHANKIMQNLFFVFSAGFLYKITLSFLFLICSALPSLTHSNVHQRHTWSQK